jgi:hypothetical protein
VSNLELVVLQPGKESAEYALDDVFGVNAAGKPLTDPAARERYEAINVRIKQLPRSILIALSAACKQIIVGRRHVLGLHGTRRHHTEYAMVGQNSILFLFR